MKALLKEHGSVIALMFVCAGLSYWWQLYQGSTDLEWNLGMGLFGALGGLFIYMAGRT